MSKKPVNRLRTNQEESQPENNNEVPKSQVDDFSFAKYKKQILFAALALVLLFVSVFLFKKIKSSTSFDKLLKTSNLEQLIEAKQLDSALVILDSAAKLQDISAQEQVKLTEMRNLLLKNKFEKDKTSANVLTDCVNLMKEFRFDEAYAKCEQANAAGAVNPRDKEFFEQFKSKVMLTRDSFATQKNFFMPFTHRVRAGETLGIIAAKYFMTVNDIKKLNHISADWIREGQNLTVWVKAKPVTHLVEQGESITAIARKYNMTVKNFKFINHLESDVIKKGQKLRAVNILQE
jgi:LysM repeat protein